MKKSAGDEIKLFEVNYNGRTAWAKIRLRDIPLVSRFSWRLRKSPTGELEAIATVNGYELEMSSLINHPAQAVNVPGVN